MNIYGRERVEYTLNINSGEILSGSTIWTLDDTNLDGTNNTKVVDTGEMLVDMVYESKGVKGVEAISEFDDGWGNIYEHRTNINVTAVVYSVPVVNMSWEPQEPTIVDDVVFAQAHIDTRDGAQVYGRIDEVRMDYYTNGIWDVDYVGKTDNMTYRFLTKEDGINNTLQVTYWDGWEHQTTSISRVMNMSNIPPVSQHSREDAGKCIPAYVWTATSIDLDDDVSTLTYEWSLYMMNELGEYGMIDDGVGIEYTYPFQYEGLYKLVLKTIDAEGDWHEKVDEFPITFDVCGTSTGGSGCSGIVRLESNRFEMVSVPVRGRKVADYFLTKVEEAAGRPVNEVIEFVKAYPSNSVSSMKYVGFVPGVTNVESSYNFKLVEDDNGVEAHVPFLVKTKEFEGVLEIAWSTEDEVV